MSFNNFKTNFTDRLLLTAVWTICILCFLNLIRAAGMSTIFSFSACISALLSKMNAPVRPTPQLQHSSKLLHSTILALTCSAQPLDSSFYTCCDWLLLLFGMLAVCQYAEEHCTQARRYTGSA